MAFPVRFISLFSLGLTCVFIFSRNRQNLGGSTTCGTGTRYHTKKPQPAAYSIPAAGRHSDIHSSPFVYLYHIHNTTPSHAIFRIKVFLGMIDLLFLQSIIILKLMVKLLNRY
jgi:hypothetical protein